MAKAKKAKEPRGPYVNYSMKQIESMESDCFVIQVGTDYFDVEGKIRFSKTAANMYLMKIQNELQDSIEGGDDEERVDAHRILLTLRVLPFRFM